MAAVSAVSVSIVRAEPARRAEDDAKRLLWQLGGQRARPPELRSQLVFGGAAAREVKTAAPASDSFLMNRERAVSPGSSIFPVYLPDASVRQVNANATFSAFREDAQPRYCSSLTFSIQSTALPSSALLDGDVGHGGCRRGAVPVLLAGREGDDVAGANFLDSAALALRPAEPMVTMRIWPKRMRMPGGAGAGLERDRVASRARWRGRVQTAGRCAPRR